MVNRILSDVTGPVFVAAFVYGSFSEVFILNLALCIDALNETLRSSESGALRHDGRQNNKTQHANSCKAVGHLELLLFS